ncbi:hypothetical protein ElyMa_006065200 [Elysia marginata]|uniref:Uncharacterized protein n=1 Tax=Elysia marginata TaxID=1093978 RepID=A0AAV4GMJ8_9GAST|nr:hypothetical protein ElyMa_006065200 [Elysia marginata]
MLFHPRHPDPASSAHETPLFSVVSPSTNRDMDVTSTDDEWVCQSHQSPQKPGNHDPFIAAEEEFMVDEEDGAESSPNLATFLTKRFGTLTQLTKS